MKNTDCPFCSIPSERIIYENNTGYIISDGFPVSPGHTLIIPKTHYFDFFDVPPEQRVKLLELVEHAKRILDKQHTPSGYNLGINCGTSAGQTVLHVHIHLIPRYEGDQEDPRGGVRWIIPEKAKYW